MVMAIVLLLTVIGAVLRWNGLRDHGLWLDEIGEAVTASLPMPQLLATVRSQAEAAPLDFLGVRAVVGILGDGTTEARLWAFGMGVAAIPLAYWAGVRLSGSRVGGLVAALLVTTSPFLIEHSREARFYSAAVACTLLVIGMHGWATARPHRLGRWVAYGTAVAAGILTQYALAILPVALVLGDAVRLIARRRRRARAVVRGQLVALGLVGIITVPWLANALPFQLGRAATSQPNPSTLDAWVATFSTLATGTATPEPAPAIGVVILLALAAAGFLLRPSGSAVALGVVALLSVHAAFAGSLPGARQLIALLPVVYLLAGRGIASLATINFPAPASRGPLVGASAAVIWVALLGGQVASVLGRSGSPLEDWPGATRFVAAARCPDGRVYSNVGIGHAYGIGYYDPALRDVTDKLGQDGESVQDAVQRTNPSPSDMLVILAYVGGADSPDVRGLGSMRSWFAERDWSETVFGSQLFVYHRETCAAVSRS